MEAIPRMGRASHYNTAEYCFDYVMIIKNHLRNKRHPMTLSKFPLKFHSDNLTCQFLFMKCIKRPGNSVDIEARTMMQLQTQRHQ